MHLQFLGAARIVTGSQYLVRVGDANVLVDCGLYQGRDPKLHQAMRTFQFDPARIDAVVLTHAHIDHAGLLPRLCKLGFAGPIYTTSATTDLCGAMLVDSAHIQEEDAKWDMRKWRRGQQNTPPPSPLYGIEDAEACLEQFRPVEYEQEVQVAPGVSARWLDAGHIIGAASIEMWLTEGTRKHKVVFSGDIGSSGRPILRDPTVPSSADFVVMESTYGDRVHPPEEDVNSELAEIINRTVRQKGQILVPAFAVGRTQDLLYRLDRLMSAGSIPKLPVFVDSPLAKKATEIVSSHQECYDLDALRLLGSGDDPISFPSLKFTHSVEESQRLNNVDYPAIIISASGMCTAGRIRHHLHHRLERGNNLVLFVGFQAEGTLGRLLVDGIHRVKLFGRQHRVRARIAMIQGLSAHGDQTELLSWAKAISDPEAFFITHGEPESAFTFAGLLEKETGVPCSVPSGGVGIDLADPDALTQLHRITQQDRGRPA